MKKALILLFAALASFGYAGTPTPTKTITPTVTETPTITETSTATPTFAPGAAEVSQCVSFTAGTAQSYDVALTWAPGGFVSVAVRDYRNAANWIGGTPQLVALSDLVAFVDYSSASVAYARTATGIRLRFRRGALRVGRAYLICLQYSTVVP